MLIKVFDSYSLDDACGGTLHSQYGEKCLIYLSLQVSF
jgi:hypothetical protein